MRQQAAIEKILCFVLLLSACHFSAAQDYNEYIHTKDGKSLVTKHNLIIDCVYNYGAPAGNPAVTQICECQVNLLERRYTFKQVKGYLKKNVQNALYRLMQDDTLLQQQIQLCTKNLNVSLQSIPDYRQGFVKRCIDQLKAASDKPLSDTLASTFCNCAVDIIEQRKITLEKMDDLSDPSSLLFNEVAYKCGSPFLEASDFAKDWKAANARDIVGPPTDSVPVISIMGMHKIKIKIGNEVKVWMIDSGASDLLVSDEFAKTLKEKGFLSELNYIGEGRYAMADNRIVLCKRYKIDSIQIGHMTVNNVILATSKGTAEFLIGKSLLNKFSEWGIDNKNNFLILKK